jgi:hypothetical protein
MELVHMKAALSILSLAVVAALAGCGGEGAGASPAGSGTTAAKSTADAKSTGDAAAPAAPAKTSAASSFPAQALPEPFTTLTVGAPPGAKLEKGVTGDYATIEGADYVFKIEEAKDTDVAKLKEFLSKGGAKYIVDQPDGIVAEMPQKSGGNEYMVLRYLKIADKSYKCETTMKGAPKTADKAQEAFDAGGTLTAK